MLLKARALFCCKPQVFVAAAVHVVEGVHILLQASQVFNAAAVHVVEGAHAILLQECVEALQEIWRRQVYAV